MEEIVAKVMFVGAILSPVIAALLLGGIWTFYLTRSAWRRWKKSKEPGASFSGRMRPDEKAAVQVTWKEWVPWALIVSGWSLVTWGIAALTSWKTWPLSIGLLLLLAGGIRPVALIFWEGFYAMVLEEDEPKEEE